MNSAVVQSFVKGGIFPLYKPQGIRTMELLNIVKEKWKQTVMTSSEESELPKVGQGGVLDHFAHGVIVVGVGASCQALGSFMNNCQKKYIARGKLGEELDTDSRGGNLVRSMDYQHVTHEQMETVIGKFRGEVWQRVPLYSNVKVRGRRMVDYAAEGIYVKQKKRKVHIYSLDLIDVSLPFFEIQVLSSSGTYIRSLIRDIGTELGSVAHTHSLCRLQQGPFKIGETLTLQDCDLSRVVESIQANAECVKNFLSQSNTRNSDPCVM